MEDIKRVKLSEIVELITKGTTPTTLGYEFQDEGVNFLKIECFDENGGFIESKVAHISEECHKKMKRSQLKMVIYYSLLLELLGVWQLLQKRCYLQILIKR